MSAKWIITLIVLLTYSHTNSFAWTNIQVPTESEQHLSFGQTFTDELNPDHISLLVWNIYKGERENWPRDIKKLSYSKDLILLQEMLLTEEMNTVFDSFVYYQFDAAISFIYKKTNVPTGVLTGSIARPSMAKAMRTRKREPILKTPKTSLVTKYRLKGRDDSLLVINIHSINFVSLKTFISQFSKFNTILKDHKGPAIFAGDFNTWSKERFNFLDRFMSSHDLKAIEFDQDDRMTFFGNPLDYIFIKGLNYSDAKVLSDFTSSDHKPLAVKLNVL